MQFFIIIGWFIKMEECMQTCQKLDRSRAPQARTNDELIKLRKYMAEVFHIPGTMQKYPKAPSPVIWLSVRKAYKYIFQYFIFQH